MKIVQDPTHWAPSKLFRYRRVTELRNQEAGDGLRIQAMEKEHTRGSARDGLLVSTIPPTRRPKVGQCYFEVPVEALRHFEATGDFQRVLDYVLETYPPERTQYIQDALARLYAPAGVDMTTARPLEHAVE